MAIGCPADVANGFFYKSTPSIPDPRQSGGINAIAERNSKKLRVLHDKNVAPIGIMSVRGTRQGG
jgi:hypothetical protein